MTIVKSRRPRWVERQIEMSKYAGKRKHSSFLSKEEENIIWDRLKSIKDWDFTRHALDRIEQKGIRATKEDIISVINNGSIVEYKIDYIERINRCEERVVLSSNAIVNDCYRLKVVYSLSRQTVVTVWINHVNDFHATLDWTQYTRDMKVFGAE